MRIHGLPRGVLERLFQTLQDRLVKELRLAGAATLVEANQVLERYLPIYNQRFRVLAAERTDLHRRVPAEVGSQYGCFASRPNVASMPIPPFSTRAESTSCKIASKRRRLASSNIWTDRFSYAATIAR